MDFLTGSGRVGRVLYLATNVAIVIVVLVLVSVTDSADPATGDAQISGFGFGIIALGVWLHITNVVRRIHDTGDPRSRVFVLLIPIIGQCYAAFLLLQPGMAPVQQRAMPREGRRRGKGEHPDDDADYHEYLNDDGSFDMNGLFSKER